MLCRSTAPSAFTGYAFHVVEALIVFANEILVCFLFPLHMGLHRWYHILTTVIHEGGWLHVGLGSVGPACCVMVLGLAAVLAQGVSMPRYTGLNTFNVQVRPVPC